MNLSLATRIFLGYAVVLVTFGAVSIFSVAEMHRNQLEIRMVSHGYLELAQDVASLETSRNAQKREIEEILNTDRAALRGGRIQLVKLYYSQQVLEKISAAQGRIQEVRDFTPASEAEFVESLDAKLKELAMHYTAYQAAAKRILGELENENAAADGFKQTLEAYNHIESLVGHEIGALRSQLERRIQHRVDETERRERRSGVAIISLSVLAIAVGLIATAISARTLRPVKTLIEGVSRIGRGDYTAKLGIQGHDEIAVLAREFDAMARSLKEREEQLRENQEALLRAERLAVVGRVSAQVAHEVRNPLSSIGLNVELLDEILTKANFASPLQRKEVQEVSAAITRELDRLTEITDEYLRMARLPKPNLAQENLNEVIGRVLDFSQQELRQANVIVERKLSDHIPRTLADEGQLRQVFLNLLRNSREAMRGGGKLLIESRANDGYVEVLFRDTGSGMPQDIQKKIFEPFFSTKEGGTGLGLAVAREIVQAHHGSIACESSPGRGTTFVIKLPRA